MTSFRNQYGGQNGHLYNHECSLTMCLEPMRLEPMLSYGNKISMPIITEKDIFRRDISIPFQI